MLKNLKKAFEISVPFGIVFVALIVICCVLIIIAMWKIFEKANLPGYYAVIPVYNVYVLFKLVWNEFNFYFSVVLLILSTILDLVFEEIPNVFILVVSLTISIVSLIHTIELCNRISHSFNHKVGYTIGLLFLPAVFLLILGLKSDEYKKAEKRV